jgi:hypothetical protein
LEAKRAVRDPKKAAPKAEAPAEPAPKKKVTRWMRVRRAALVVLLSSAVGFAIAELVCRGLYGAPLAERLPLMEVRANKTRGFEMIPDTVHYTYLEPVRVNNLGLRGEDVGEKTPGEIRVLALGDSMVYGQGMGAGDTLPAQIELALRAPLGASPAADKIRVINGGVRAYNTRQELALLAEVWERVKPDITILFWFANDVDDPDIDALCRRFARSGPVVFDLGAPMTGRAEFAWRAKQLLRRSALVMELWHAYSDAHWPVETPETLDKAFEKLDGYMGEFARLAELGRFDFLVAVVPLSRVARQEGADHPLTHRVKALSEAHGFPFLDLVDPVRALCRSTGKTPVLPYDGHYDASANAAMGKYVADELRKDFPARFAVK